jgi:uncharacterized protein YjbI with pentapeptide repeats
VRTAAVMAALALAAVAPAPAAERPDTRAQLERQKLEQEIEKLELENRNESGWRGFLSSYAALLTGLAAVGGVVVALLRQQQERRLEGERRLDERFTAILGELGNEREPIRAGAAVSLLSFTRPDRTQYHRQVRLIALANLKVEHPDPVRKLLVRVLEEALRTKAPIEPLERDLSYAWLPDARLGDLDLAGASLRHAHLAGADLSRSRLQRVAAYKATLTGARFVKAQLSEADLEQAQCERAQFFQADLTSARMRRANLRQARFEDARLQSAHLEGADLTGARFGGADLNDAYLTGATLDESAMRSLTSARNLERTHLAAETRAELARYEKATRTPAEADEGSQQEPTSPEAGRQAAEPG